MQAAGDRYITFTSKGGTNGQMLDLETKKPIRTMSPEIDPFPLPEGDLIVQPRYIAGKSELAFYRTSDLRDKGIGAQPLFIDSNFAGTYQSLGVLSKSADRRIIRVYMVTNEIGKIQDYSIQSENSNYNIKPVYPLPIEMCKNLNLKLAPETPFISRDGRKLAMIDPSENVTKIYDLEMPSGNCTESLSLEARTDKVSFSFDGSSISYKTQRKHKGYWGSVLVVRNLNTGKVIVINKPQEEVLYHSWSSSGNFLYTVAERVGFWGYLFKSSSLKIVSGNALTDHSECFTD